MIDLSRKHKKQIKIGKRLFAPGEERRGVILSALAHHPMRYSEIWEIWEKYPELPSDPIFQRELKDLEARGLIEHKTELDTKKRRIARYHITDAGRELLKSMEVRSTLVHFDFNTKEPQMQMAIFATREIGGPPKADRLLGVMFVPGKNAQSRFASLVQFRSEGTPTLGKVQGFVAFLVNAALNRVSQGGSIPGPNDWATFLEVLDEWQQEAQAKLHTTNRT